MVAAPGGWRRAVVREVDHPHPRAVVLRLAVPDREEHSPGQHYIVRLTAEDGYTASRSYSVSSPPSDPLVELYVERLPDGEVSVYLADVVRPGDELQVRGPIGGWFVWGGHSPAVGIGGGTGAAPLVAMLRHARDLGTADLLNVVAAARTLGELPYADELAAAGAVLVLSQQASPTGRAAARLTRDDLQVSVVGTATHYVCGSGTFAEAASTLLTELGVSVRSVRVERFGPSG